MRGVIISLLVLTAMLLSACGANGIPTSSLTIRNATTDALISAPEAQGTVTLGVGDVVQIKVMHTTTDNNNNNTQSNDITQFTYFFWDSGSCATIDQLGNITGLTPGTAVLRAKFTPDFAGDSDTCRLTVVVN